jgi:hypothetical protein
MAKAFRRGNAVRIGGSRLSLWVDPLPCAAVKRLLLLLPVLLAALAGCGSNDAGPADDESDTRAGVFACITDEKGIDARLDGDEEIVLDGIPDAPRIRFYLTAGEAEAAQFEGDVEGAEQIGAALLFLEPEVNEESEDLLTDVEDCLADQ